jgi:hypothetical protein
MTFVSALNNNVMTFPMSFELTIVYSVLAMYLFGAAHAVTILYFLSFKLASSSIHLSLTLWTDGVRLERAQRLMFWE